MSQTPSQSQHGNASPHHTISIPKFPDFPSLSSAILLAALDCPLGLAALSGTPSFERLPAMLSRWKALGCPDPELPLGDKLLVEFEKRLEAWEENQSPIKSTIHHTEDTCLS